MAHPVNWFSIEGKDPAALSAFYSKLFGWKTAPGPGTMTFIPAEKGGIPGGIQASKTGSPSVSVYVSVKDVSDYLDRAVKGGATAALEKMELPGNMGWIAGFIDPAGNFTGLWEAPKKSAKKAAKKAEKKAEKMAKAAAKKPAKAAPAKAPATKPAPAAKKPAAKKPAPKKK